MRAEHPAVAGDNAVLLVDQHRVGEVRPASAPDWGCRLGGHMFRATGPGKVEVSADFSGVGVLGALLYNFDFDDFADLKYRDLKVEHASFLADHVVPLLGDDRGNIWMQGSASRIGSNAWNMEVSQTRVGRVVNFLSARGINSEGQGDSRDS